MYLAMVPLVKNSQSANTRQTSINTSLLSLTNLICKNNQILITKIGIF